MMTTDRNSSYIPFPTLRNYPSLVLRLLLLIKGMGMQWQADLIEPVWCWLPLNQMVVVDLIAFQAVPYIQTSQRCLRPMVTLAFHLLPVFIFPIRPFQLRIRGNIFIKDHNREVQTSAPIKTHSHYNSAGLATIHLNRINTSKPCVATKTSLISKNKITPFAFTDPNHYE